MCMWLQIEVSALKDSMAFYKKINKGNWFRQQELRRFPEELVLDVNFVLFCVMNNNEG